MLGHWIFDYSIIPHASSWQTAWQEADGFNRPLRALSTKIHAGPLAPSTSFIKGNSDLLRITAVKSAEDSQGWILRGYNLSSQPLKAIIQVDLPFHQVFISRMDETNLRELTASETHEVELSLRGNEVFTLRFV